MPSFSRSLEKALHQALAFANERHQEYATLEHLLLSLIDDQDAAAVMRACNVDLDQLRKSIVEYIDTELENLVVDGMMIQNQPPVSSASFSVLSFMFNLPDVKK